MASVKVPLLGHRFTAGRRGSGLLCHHVRLVFPEKTQLSPYILIYTDRQRDSFERNNSGSPPLDYLSTKAIRSSTPERFQRIEFQVHL
ncbi:hypothetical protein JG688_00013408 [Phytophthora aleatoria]|uniref:Uncharacterized protein n=1 Tax=Phytophthora aleatoria TaxID=2496075 RepID=A0A8J5IDM0_9STRA|nr:hypothetical protein JG688_00013408 [Phytophthora aleatoria]